MAAKKHENTEPEVFAQEADGRGRIRLDRRFTGAEAAAQDRANRERYLEERAKRFEGRVVE